MSSLENAAYLWRKSLFSEPPKFWFLSFSNCSWFLTFEPFLRNPQSSPIHSPHTSAVLNHLLNHHSGIWMPDRVTGFINNCHQQNSFLSTLRLFSVSSSCRAYTQGKDLLSNSSSAVLDGWAGLGNFAINF